MIPVINVTIRVYRKENGGAVAHTQIEEDGVAVKRIDFALLNIELDALKVRILESCAPDLETVEGSVDVDEEGEDDDEGEVPD
jgi:hypothetical protein